MFAFLKLIRFHNLLIIASSQYLVRWCIIQPILQFNGMELQMSEGDFFLLSLSTVMIAAAGYTINDYFDIKIDRVNKPKKMVVGIAIKRRVAMGAHLTMNLIAISIGIYLAWRAGLSKLAFINIISAATLWFYSTTFKKQVLIGNLMIALLAGLVPLTVGLYEIPLLAAAYGDVSVSATSLSIIFYFIIGYSILAFLTNLIREIVKDMEDHEGDRIHGCVTFPVKYGMEKSKMLLVLLVILIMSALGFIQYYQYVNDSLIPFYYVLFAIQLPFAFIVYLVATAKEKNDFSRVSTLTKITMLTGVLSMLVFYFTLK